VVSTAVSGSKGIALSAGGEIPALATVKDEAGAMSRRLKEASQRLSQVSCARLWFLPVSFGLWSYVCLSGG
jgi:hypothetical protein